MSGVWIAAKALLLLAVCLFVLAPLVFVFAGSFNEETLVFPPAGLTVKWYLDIPAPFWNGLKASLIVAVVSSLVALPVGITGAYAVVRGRFPGRELFNTMLLSPLTVPLIVLGMALYQYYVVIWRVTGYPLPGSLIGVIIGHTSFTVPFVAQSVIAGLGQFDPSLEDAARDLGASEWTTFRHITLPLLKPSIVAGGLFAFLSSMENFPLSLFLVEGDSTTLPVVIFSFVEFDLSPVVLAISSIVLLASIVVVVLLDQLMGLDELMGLRRV